MRKFLLFVLFVCGFSFDVIAGSNIGKDAAFYKFIGDLNENNKRVASFIQTKTFLKYNKSFVVTGWVKFIKDVGVLWQQETPKKFQFVSTKGQYCLNDKTHREMSTLPYMDRIKNMVDEAIEGDFSKVEEAFFVDYSEDVNKKNWNLVLVPKLSRISGVIKKISLSGDVKNLLDFSIEYLNGVFISVVFDELNEERDNEIKC